jgi:2',3'-cyclic-nucleotide 2'-phosphodiesterase (5'-nucleotidase family)
MPAVGGVARRATVINQERKRNSYTLVLDAGDSLTGDQDPALKTQGKSSVDAMNRLGYDAMALGPGDLALGLATLRARMAEAKFPMLSANAVVTGTAELVAQPYTVREMAGHRIAIVGLSGGKGTAEIGVRDPLAAVQEIVPKARQEAAIVILLSHAGQVIDQQIADRVPGIAAIVSGGEGARQKAWESAATGVPVYHADQALAGHAGRMFGVGKLNFDASGKLKSQKWQQIALDPDFADDPTLATWVQEHLDR